MNNEADNANERIATEPMNDDAGIRNRRNAKVAVVMGGSSAEREISILTGAGVMRALQSLGYDAQSLDYDVRFVEAIREIAPDVVFNALHGPGGEDGQLARMLEYLRIPYTGSGVEASALAMDKHLTKKLLAAEGLPTAAWDLFDLSGGTLPLLPGSLDLPLVVKPSIEGSSQGVTIVKTHEQWTNAMLAGAKTMPRSWPKNIVAGTRIHVRRASAKRRSRSWRSCRIVAISTRSKRNTRAGGSTHLVPAKIDEDLAARLQTLALSVHRLLGLRDYSRTDFIVSKEGRPYILEINALPGSPRRATSRKRARRSAFHTRR